MSQEDEGVSARQREQLCQFAQFKRDAQASSRAQSAFMAKVGEGTSEGNQQLPQPRTQTELPETSSGTSTDSELRHIRGVLDVAFEIDPQPVKEAYLRTNFESHRAAYRLWEARQRELGSLPAQETEDNSGSSVSTPSSVDRCNLSTCFSLSRFCGIYAGGKQNDRIQRGEGSPVRRGVTSEHGPRTRFKPSGGGRSRGGPRFLQSQHGHDCGARRKRRAIIPGCEMGSLSRY